MLMRIMSYEASDFLNSLNWMVTIHYIIIITFATIMIIP